ncbi:uncharacterized protein LOC141613332 [Silene latifolia]|uniref:uncharacterized protein LOC141613332 n=1 Tax=Silene latifolia TaxID=37657 RepID=UPI003D770824
MEDIVKVSGFRIGTLPFKYLGVPISSKKLSKFEGHKLIERIVHRIRSLGARQLSYAGRLVLVKTVLSSLHSYWASIFLIPYGIMNKKEYTSPPDCNWSKRKIVQVKEIFKTCYSNNQWIAKSSGYSVADGYNWLRDNSPQVPWRHLCWNALNVSRTSFIFWASQQGKLLTLDRLHKMGIVQSTVCFICGSEAESHEHLFYKCEYRKRCMQLMQQKLHI